MADGLELNDGTATLYTRPPRASNEELAAALQDRVRRDAASIGGFVAGPWTAILWATNGRGLYGSINAQDCRLCAPYGDQISMPRSTQPWPARCSPMANSLPMLDAKSAFEARRLVDRKQLGMLPAQLGCSAASNGIFGQVEKHYADASARDNAVHPLYRSTTRINHRHNLRAATAIAKGCGREAEDGDGRWLCSCAWLLRGLG